MTKFSANNIKTIIAASLSLTMLFSGCAQSTTVPQKEAEKPSEVVASEVAKDAVKEEMLKIGIVQIADHPALDASREGFIDGLKEGGYVEGENIVIDYQNAQGDQSNLKTMASKVVRDKSNLILAIATQSAVTVAVETSDIPVLFTAVTDAVEAQIVESNEKPGKNVTGTSDLTPIAKQFELIKQVFPNLKKVGIMYNSSEVNSEIQAKMAEEEATKNGFEFQVATVSSVNDIPLVATKLAGDVELIYVPTDNLLASNIPLIVKATDAKKIPLVTGEEGGVEKGGLMTNGINYYNLGKQTGAMAVKILKGESTPAEMPVEYIDNTQIVINPASAERLGITFTDDILSVATKVEEK